MKISSVNTPKLMPAAFKKAGSGELGFKDALNEAIDKVNTLQVQAHGAMEDLSTGKTADFHETMIAMQKADVSFKMLMQVRNKVMSAYQEIMRMSV
ncbi:MAG: flagellar hook-basal body complex protein FliE [Deltaproteobacteria bacterium]|nr:flagellar hook-basal body complex protein FliE [Deltaproteobacteria bacterium]